MKLVAVSQRVDCFPDRNEIRDALDQRLLMFLLEAGYLPVPVPNVLTCAGSNNANKKGKLDVWLSILDPKAIVLSGGNDFGEFADRDNTEDQLLAYAHKYNLPLLGICRGMQMLGHWAGTSLRPVSGHVRTRHHVSGTIMAEVNSFHKYSLAHCPADFRVLAQSDDGAIEAIRHEFLPWEGWMWHPERERILPRRDIEKLKELFL